VLSPVPSPSKHHKQHPSPIPSPRPGTLSYMAISSPVQKPSTIPSPRTAYMDAHLKQVNVSPSSHVAISSPVQKPSTIPSPRPAYMDAHLKQSNVSPPSQMAISSPVQKPIPSPSPAYMSHMDAHLKQSNASPPSQRRCVTAAPIPSVFPQDSPPIVPPERCFSDRKSSEPPSPRLNQSPSLFDFLNAPAALAPFSLPLVSCLPLLLKCNLRIFFML
jgi:hypothetical protein